MTERRLENKVSQQEAERIVLKICPHIGDSAPYLVHLCGCVPLALRVSAGFLADHSSMPVASYLRDLENERKQAERRRRPSQVVPKIEAVLNLSYRSLIPEAQTALRYMSVFPISFNRAAAATLLGRDDQQSQQVARLSLEDILELLHRRSLLEWDVSSKRYHLDHMVRIFAYARLKTPNEVYEAHLRHACHFFHVAKRANDLCREGDTENLRAGLMVFNQERPHIDAFWDWASRQPPTPATDTLLLNYAGVTVPMSDLEYYKRRERIPQLQASLAAAGRMGHRDVEVALLGSLGSIYESLGEVHRAIACYDQCLVVAQKSDKRYKKPVPLNEICSGEQTFMGRFRRAVRRVLNAFVGQPTNSELPALPLDVNAVAHSRALLASNTEEQDQTHIDADEQMFDVASQERTTVEHDGSYDGNEHAPSSIEHDTMPESQQQDERDTIHATEQATTLSDEGTKVSSAPSVPQETAPRKAPKTIPLHEIDDSELVQAIRDMDREQHPPIQTEPLANMPSPTEEDRTQDGTTTPSDEDESAPPLPLDHAHADESAPPLPLDHAHADESAPSLPLDHAHADESAPPLPLDHAHADESAPPLPLDHAHADETSTMDGFLASLSEAHTPSIPPEELQPAQAESAADIADAEEHADFPETQATAPEESVSSADEALSTLSEPEPQSTSDEASMPNIQKPPNIAEESPVETPEPAKPEEDYSGKKISVKDGKHVTAMKAPRKVWDKKVSYEPPVPRTPKHTSAPTSASDTSHAHTTAHEHPQEEPQTPTASAPAPTPAQTADTPDTPDTPDMLPPAQTADTPNTPDTPDTPDIHPPAPAQSTDMPDTPDTPAPDTPSVQSSPTRHMWQPWKYYSDRGPGFRRAHPQATEQKASTEPTGAAPDSHAARQKHTSSSREASSSPSKETQASSSDDTSSSSEDTESAPAHAPPDSGSVSPDTHGDEPDLLSLITGGDAAAATEQPPAKPTHQDDDSPSDDDPPQDKPLDLLSLITGDDAADAATEQPPAKPTHQDDDSPSDDEPPQDKPPSSKRRSSKRSSSDDLFSFITEAAKGGSSSSQSSSRDGSSSSQSSSSRGTSSCATSTEKKPTPPPSDSGDDGEASDSKPKASARSSSATSSIQGTAQPTHASDTTTHKPAKPADENRANTSTSTSTATTKKTPSSDRPGGVVTSAHTPAHMPSSGGLPMPEAPTPELIALVMEPAAKPSAPQTSQKNNHRNTTAAKTPAVPPTQPTNNTSRGSTTPHTPKPPTAPPAQPTNNSRGSTTPPAPKTPDSSPTQPTNNSRGSTTPPAPKTPDSSPTQPTNNSRGSTTPPAPKTPDSPPAQPTNNSRGSTPPAPKTPDSPPAQPTNNSHGAPPEKKPSDSESSTDSYFSFISDLARGKKPPQSPPESSHQARGAQSERKPATSSQQAHDTTPKSKKPPESSPKGHNAQPDDTPNDAESSRSDSYFSFIADVAREGETEHMLSDWNPLTDAIEPKSPSIGARRRKLSSHKLSSPGEFTGTEFLDTQRSASESLIDFISGTVRTGTSSTPDSEDTEGQNSSPKMLDASTSAIKNLSSLLQAYEEEQSGLRNATILLGFLLAIAIAEFLMFFVHPYWGLIFHALLLIVLNIYPALRPLDSERRFMLALTIIPMSRLVSLITPWNIVQVPSLYPNLPDTNTPFIIEQSLVSVVLLITMVIACWHLVPETFDAITSRFWAAQRFFTSLRKPLKAIGQAMHYRPRIRDMFKGFYNTFLYLARMGAGILGGTLIGLVVGLFEYTVMPHAPSSMSLELTPFWVILLFLTFFLGATEELIYRGFFQVTARRALGRIAFFYTSLLFATMHLHYQSVQVLAYAFLMGILFSYLVHWSKLVITAIVAHGVANITTFFIVPFLSDSLRNTVHEIAPWVIIGSAIFVGGGMVLLIITDYMRHRKAMVANPLERSVS